MKILIYDSNSQSCGEINDDNAYAFEIKTSLSIEEVRNKLDEMMDKEEVDFFERDEALNQIKEILKCELNLISSSWTALDEGVDTSFDIYW